MIPTFCAAFLLSAMTVDDRVIADVDALIAAPVDPIPFGQTIASPGIEIAVRDDLEVGRVIIDVGDVTGDGFSDVAIGFDAAPGARTLCVLDGQTGLAVWSASPRSGRFRWFQALDVADGLLAVAASAPGAAVELRAADDGTIVWSRDLVAPDASDPADVYSVKIVPDLTGDGNDDVLVAGGHRVDGVALLSGVDGATAWFAGFAEEVIDARLASDIDDDGVRDIAAVGGDAAPFVTMISGRDGCILWQAALDGPGSVVLPTGDFDDDGIADLVIGEYDDFNSCLHGISGRDGTVVWEAFDVFRNVTTLDTFDDLDGDGIDEVVIGSFDNSITGVLGGNGGFQFRREVSTFNTGAILSVAAGGDVDGNGTIDCYGGSVDNYVYAVDSGMAARLWIADTRTKQIAITSLADGTGDGRREVATVGRGTLFVYDGSSGLATGPQIFIQPKGLGEETDILVFSYPATKIALLGALGTGPGIDFPAYDKPFQLDLATTTLILDYLGPPAGGQGFQLPIFPRELVGVEVFIQAGALYSPGFGLMSEVASYTISE